MNGIYFLVGDEYKRWEQYKDSEIYGFTFTPSFPYRNSLSMHVDVMFDSAQCYMKYNHPLWLYFKNGYLPDSEWVPLIVTANCQYIPLPDFELKIAAIHYSHLCSFSRRFYKQIELLANKEIDYEEFSIYVRGVAAMDNQNPYIMGGEILSGIALVTDNETGKHNFEKDGKLISPQWFDFFKSFKEHHGKQRIEVLIDKESHFLYIDGTLE